MALSSDTKITAIFVVLGVLTWQVARTATTSDLLALAALVGIGIVLPTLLNEWRSA